MENIPEFYHSTVVAMSVISGMAGGANFIDRRHQEKPSVITWTWTFFWLCAMIMGFSLDPLRDTAKICITIVPTLVILASLFPARKE